MKIHQTPNPAGTRVLRRLLPPQESPELNTAGSGYTQESDLGLALYWSTRSLTILIHRLNYGYVMFGLHNITVRQ